MSTTTGPRLLLAGVVALALQATPVLVGFAAGDDVASESVTCPTVATAPINSTPIARPDANSGGSAVQDRGIGNDCSTLHVVGAPGTGRVIGGFGLTEPNQRAAFAYIAASVEIPRQPILDRDGNVVNRAFFCDVPLIDLTDTHVAVTIWCHGPRDLPREVIGLLSLDSVIDVPGDQGEKTVVVGHCEERLPIPSHRVFWCDVPRPIGPLPAVGTPVPAPAATP